MTKNCTGSDCSLGGAECPWYRQVSSKGGRKRESSETAEERIVNLKI